jgi:hypothetical protein
MNFKKSLYLFLALLLPVCTFLFLKQFGVNEFVVKPLFEESAELPVSCAQYSYQFPYAVADSVLAEIHRNPDDALLLVVIDDTLPINKQERAIQLGRVVRQFPEYAFSIKVYTDDFKFYRTNLADLRVDEMKSNTAIETLKNCVFLMTAHDDAVLINQHNRIVGKYSLTNREDADRLLVEMKILLHQY